MSNRRLPVYFLLDCSESMIGPAVSLVQTGVETMIRALRTDPQALETAHVSLITFDHEAHQILPLTELLQVQVPKLKVGPGTALGACLRKLKQCIEREVRVTSSEQKGDYRPIAFLLTDGQPTDEWRTALDELRDMKGTRVANIYAVGCGDDVDFDLLAKVSDVAFRLDEITAEKMNKLFIWLTASIQTASVAASGADAVDRLNIEKLPPEVSRVDPRTARRPSGPPRQVFLNAQCSVSGQHFVMRYGYDQYSDSYLPTAAHPADDRGLQQGQAMPKLAASKLNGVPPCCYCENPGAGACSCGCVMCLPSPPPKTIVCPRCGSQLHQSGGHGDFDLRQSAG